MGQESIIIDGIGKDMEEDACVQNVTLGRVRGEGFAPVSRFLMTETLKSVKNLVFSSKTPFSQEIDGQKRPIFDRFRPDFFLIHPVFSFFRPFFGRFFATRRRQFESFWYGICMVKWRPEESRRSIGRRPHRGHRAWHARCAYDSRCRIS